MAIKRAPANHYEALRVERTSYLDGGPQPKHAQLALHAAEAITHILLQETVVDSRDQPIVPVSTTLRSRHDPSAPNAFDIPNLHLQQPVRRPSRSTEFWLFNQRQLEDASLRPPGDLAFPIVVALRGIFAGTEYWNGRFMLLKSGSRRISLPNLAVAMDEAPIEVPVAPLNTREIVTYAANIGNFVAARATGAKDVGDAVFRSESYHFVPRSRTLVPEEGAPDAEQMVVVPPR